MLDIRDPVSRVSLDTFYQVSFSFGNEDKWYKQSVSSGSKRAAGTGFKHYKDLELQTNKPNTVIQTQTANIKDTVLRSRFNQLVEKQKNMLDF